MQKKTFFGTLVVALCMTASGVLTSCKDYDDDISSLYQFIITNQENLNEALQTQIDAINKELSNLKTEQAICKDNCQKLLAQLQNEVEKLQEEVDALREMQESTDAEQELMAAEIDALKNTIAAHVTEIKTLRAEYDSLLEQYNALTVTIFNVENEVAKIDAHLSQVEDIVELQDKSIEQLTQTTVVLQQALSEANNALAALVAQVEQQQELLKANTADIEKNAEAIKANADKIKGLEALMAGMTDDLKKVTENAESALLNAAKAYELAKQNAEDIAGLKNTVDEHSGKITANTEAIALIYGDIDNMKKIVDGNKEAAEKAVADLEKSLNSKIDVLEGKLNTALDLAQGAKDLATTANVNAAQALANSVANKALVDGLTTDVNTLKAKLNDIASWQTDVNGKIADLYDKLSKIVITSDCYTKDEMDSKLENLKNDLDGAIKEIKDNYATKTDVDGYLKSLHTTIDGEISELRAELMGEVGKVKDMLADYYTKQEIDNLLMASFADYYTQTEIDGMIGDIEGRLDGVEAKFADYYTKDDVDLKVSALEKAYKQADAELSGKIAALEKSISAVQDDINAIKESLANYLDSIKKQITSIIIQGTYNPVIGTFNLPTSLSSNILSAFYGKSTKDSPKWPVCGNGLTSEEASLVGLNETFPVYSGELMLSDDEKAYAGKVYLTVNPSSVDFSNTTFSLVNSKDEESALRLGELVPSDKEITFGWTRAVSNGFYEADAYIDMDDIEKVKASNYVDVASLKSVAKEALNKLRDHKNNDFNVTNAYKTIESALGTSLPALGVKSWWQWKDENNEMQSSSVYSQYAIAGIAIQPLSYEFLKDWDAPQLKTIAHQEFQFAFDINIPTFDPISEPNLTVNVYQIKARIEMGGTVNEIVIGISATNDFSEYGAQKIKKDWDDAHDNPKEKAVIYTYTFTAQGLSDFINQINESIVDKANASFENLKNDVNKQIQDEINKVTDKLNTKVIDRINKVITKVNDVIKNANHYLQPTMIYYNQTTSKWALVSNSMVVPTAVKLNADASKNYVVIEPTTFTAELLSPAYKKYVAVTNVLKSDFSADAKKGGDATCRKLLAEANAKGIGLNQIFSGYVDRGLYLPEAGYIYEITFVALDYSGNTVRTTFYFKAI